ncbi:MAG: hypothetical protein ACKODA_04105, partial [Nevskiaceae bacterium]
MFARAFRLVWSTSRSLTLAFVVLTVVAGVLPAAIAYIGAQIVDAVVAASGSWPAGAAFDLAALRAHPDALIVLELVLQEGV